MFESSVDSYGSQTVAMVYNIPPSFESSVDSYGSQTYALKWFNPQGFESSVDSYGSQTAMVAMNQMTSLRVV